MNAHQYDFLPWSEEAILADIQKLRNEMADMRKAMFARMGELKKEHASIVAEIEELRITKEGLIGIET